MFEHIRTYLIEAYSSEVYDFSGCSCASVPIFPFGILMIRLNFPCSYVAGSSLRLQIQLSNSTLTVKP